MLLIGFLDEFSQSGDESKLIEYFVPCDPVVQHLRKCFNQIVFEFVLGGMRRRGAGDGVVKVEIENGIEFDVGMMIRAFLFASLSLLLT